MPRARASERDRIRELEARLAEAEETLRAIRGGEVDAIVVYGPQGERIFTLAGAEHSYRVLVEAMNEGAATVDGDGSILYCNAAFARMLSTAIERVIGSGLREHVPPAHAADLDALLEVGRGGAWNAEIPLLARGGALVPALLSASGMDVDGKRLVCVVATDLSDQRRAAAMRTAAAERERLLRQVEALVDDLRAAVEARDQFLSVASHELKTPLTALALHVDGLRRVTRDHPLPPRAQDRLDGIARQGVRLAKLVSELLDVARIQAGRVELALEPVDLSAVACEVVDRFAHEAAEAGSVLQLRADPVVGLWDRSRLDQVATNLVSNALKYGRGSPVQVSVEAAGERARLVVRDRGIGIEPQHHDRIFQRFERAVSPAEFGGMGLGLWITREIVQRLGGTICVESVPGDGATFTVELPLRMALGSDGTLEPRAQAC